MALDSVVTPTMYTPGIVSDSDEGRPYWSSAAPGDVAHFATAASSRESGRVENYVGSHFIRDAIERNTVLNELRAMRGGFGPVPFGAFAVAAAPQSSGVAELRAQMAENEVSRLRAEIQSQKLESLLAQILDKLSNPPKNGNGNGNGA